MNRKDIINFCCDQIFPQVKGEPMFYLDCKETIKLVTNWRRKNNYPQTMKAIVNDGFLFINNIPVGRIAPKTPTIFDEGAYYWEGRILARQENY